MKKARKPATHKAKAAHKATHGVAKASQPAAKKNNAKKVANHAHHVARARAGH